MYIFCAIQTKHVIAKTKEFTDVLEQQFPSFDLAKSGIEFITFRNNLNKIMGAPYNHSRSEYDTFAIDIIKKDGIIYLECVDKTEILQDNNNNNNDNKWNSNTNNDNLRPSWWGRRFEQICRNFAQISNNDDIYNNEEKKKDKEENKGDEEWIILVESQLNNHKILMAAEIDCINDKNEYVEIKTQKYVLPKRRNKNNHHRNQKYNYSAAHQQTKFENKVRYHPYNNNNNNNNNYNKSDDRNYDKKRKCEPIVPRYKCMKIWIQSYLAGVDNILIGFRNEKGIVVDIKTFSLNWFKNKISNFDKRTRQKIFQGNVCLNFTDNMLQFIKENCKSQDVVYRVVLKQPWKEVILYRQK